MPPVTDLTHGLNLMGWSASVTMRPGEALDCQDVLFRADGAVTKSFGWRRINAAALGERIIAIKGFAYKGKNNLDANPDRAGNFGLDDGAQFTRRGRFYSSAIALTTASAYRWDHATNAFSALIALPAGVAVSIDAKPTMLVLQNNVYIFGWANQVLRYDPVDRALYRTGWDNVPAMVGANITVGAGGSLVATATYLYRAAWVDLYTGEQSGLSAAISRTTTAANRTVTFAAGAFAAYAGDRHFVDAANLTNEDVGLALYRTDADGATFHFLQFFNPGLAAQTLTDNGLATDASLQADTRSYQDWPALTAAVEYHGQVFGFQWGIPPAPGWGSGTGTAILQGSNNRILYNDFRAEKSYIERWDVRNYKELPLQDGETLTAIAKAGDTLVAFTNLTAYVLQVALSPSGIASIVPRPLNWTIGCVGPKAWDFVDGWLYWLSKRGPYRWSGGPEPQWIGRNVVSLFVDPDSGLCKLNEAAAHESEVAYHRDADVVRFIFPVDGSLTPNRHIYYWHRYSEWHGGDPFGGWSYGSAQAQCFDSTNTFTGLINGLPPRPIDRDERLVMAAHGNHVNEWDPASRRAGYGAGTRATGTGQAGGSTTVVVTEGGLPTAGAGLANLRLEIAYADGTFDVRTIASNTAASITPNAPALSQTSVGATWYVGGIPAYWRSWVDHAGAPENHKRIQHLFVGYNRTEVLAARVLDIVVSADDDWPTRADRRRTAALNLYQNKALISLVGRFMTYELANSRPDERFAVTYIEPELEVLPQRRAR